MSNKKLQQFKEKIYSRINELEDETALQMLEEAIAVYSSPSKKDILDDLSEEQKQRMYESIRQADSGKTLTNDEVKKKVREWLSGSLD